MEQLLHCLRERGYKITPQRRAVIAALLASGRFATAQQISEAVKKTNPEISLDTVYCNLSLSASRMKSTRAVAKAFYLKRLCPGIIAIWPA